MSDTTPTFHVPMVLHKGYGGYELSRAAALEVARRKGWQTRIANEQVFIGAGGETVTRTVRRDDADLVAVVREMGEAAGKHLKVVEIMINLAVEDTDGYETVQAYVHQRHEG